VCAGRTRIGGKIEEELAALDRSGVDTGHR
jgi:hypothetical protein